MALLTLEIVAALADDDPAACDKLETISRRVSIAQERLDPGAVRDIFQSLARKLP